MSLSVVGFGCHGLPPPASAGSRRYPRLVCELTKQGHRFISSLVVGDPSAAEGQLRKFVSSNSKHVSLSTLSHLLSPDSTYPRLSSISFPLYSILKQQSWFFWNAKLVADLIALMYKEERLDEAEKMLEETVLKLGLKERDLCMFYCNLVDSHARHKSERGVLDTWTRLRQLILLTSSVYVKQKGYESMIAGFCEIGKPYKAEKLMYEISEKGLKPSCFELKSLVYGYGRGGFVEDMKRIIFQMEREGYELDTVCCNMVLSSLGENNQLLDMLSWLQKMRNSGVSLSIRSYNSILNSCPTIMMMLKDMKTLPLSVDELMAKLGTDEANLVMELLKSSVVNQVVDWKSSEVRLDLHGMHLSTAYLVLLQWFLEMRVRFVDGNLSAPTEVLVICGRGKHSSPRGKSPVKELAKEIVVRMKCPLRIDRKNIGCLIAKGKTFQSWMLSFKNPHEVAKIGAMIR